MISKEHVKTFWPGIIKPLDLPENMIMSFEDVREKLVVEKFIAVPEFEIGKMPFEIMLQSVKIDRLIPGKLICPAVIATMDIAE